MEQRRLARSARAHDGHDLAPLHGQAGVAERRGLAEGEHEVLRLDDGAPGRDEGRTVGRVHETTSVASAVRRAVVRSIQRRSASRWNRPWSARSESIRVPFCLRSVSSRHPVQVCSALGVQVLLGPATEHQRQDDLHEQIGLQVGLGGDGLREPRLDLVPAGLGDVVPLAIGTGSWLGVADDRLPVSRQAGERGVHLAVGQRPAAPEVGVVIALQVVAVARFAIEEAEQGHGNTHTSENTLSVYIQSIARLAPLSGTLPLHESEAAGRQPEGCAVVRIRLDALAGVRSAEVYGAIVGLMESGMQRLSPPPKFRTELPGITRPTPKNGSYRTGSSTSHENPTDSDSLVCGFVRRSPQRLSNTSSSTPELRTLGRRSRTDQTTHRGLITPRHPSVEVAGIVFRHNRVLKFKCVIRGLIASGSSHRLLGLR